MTQRNYLQLVAETPTQFWNDSGEAADIRFALDNGACGVTTNPILITRTVLAHPDVWRAAIRQFARTMPPESIPHAITAQVVSDAADLLLPTYTKTHGDAGYVCAQGNPNNHGNHDEPIHPLPEPVPIGHVSALESRNRILCHDEE